jgi:hypothetical protein
MPATRRCARYVWDLTKLCAQWNYLTLRIMLAARKERDMVGAASADFLMYSGYVTMAYFWALQAAVAQEKLDNGGAEQPEFYQAKLQTAEFYFERLLPRADRPQEVDAVAHGEAASCRWTRSTSASSDRRLTGAHSAHNCLQLGGIASTPVGGGCGDAAVLLR